MPSHRAHIQHRLVTSAAAFLMLGCLPQAVQAAEIKDYAVGELSPGEYTVVDRLWVARRGSAIEAPRHADQASAKRALLDEAARIGGDGVVNLHCMESVVVSARLATIESKVFGGSHYCYGSVIKLK
jgi:hypothetical protein